MLAVVYHGPGRLAWEEKPRPALQAGDDAIVRVLQTTICGTDLHILKGDVPTVTDGRILGHEGVGVVEEVGAGVVAFGRGDRVLISCITACGRCPACRRGMSSHCARGGWILGNTIDGTQAELVRIPCADLSLHHLPAGADEGALVMLSDIFPTGLECGVLRGEVGPGDTVAILGAGPVGLAALLAARLYAPADLIVVDVDQARLEVARRLGATQVVDNAAGQAVARVLALTGGRGVDVAIEAVGAAATFDVCQDLLAAGGRLANVGVHGGSVALKLEQLWSRNVTITTRLVDAVTTPLLLRLVATGVLKPRQLITHTFRLDEALRAYDTFGNAAREKALKVLLTAA
jgi:alcohol dehydrogenase